MKKLLILLLVLGLTSAASAATISLIGPGTGPGSSGDPLAVDGTLRVYIAIDVTGLGQLCATVTATGTGVHITGGVMKAEAGDYGVKVTDWGPGPGIFLDGGWQSGLSFDTTILGGGTAAEIGLGHMMSTIHGATTEPVVALPLDPGDLGGGGATANTPIAYIDVIGVGVGSVTLSIADGTTDPMKPFSQMEDQSPISWGDSIDLYGVPEPMTIALLGLGSLFLLRRRK